MRCLLLLALLLSGCPDLEVTCTTDARASVQVTVIDDAGNNLVDADVTWTGDDGVPTSCENNGGGEYVCGYEVSGEVTIDATRAGHEPASELVVVETDECHVITEQLTLSLVAEMLGR